MTIILNGKRVYVTPEVYARLRPIVIIIASNASADRDKIDRIGRILDARYGYTESNSVVPTLDN